MLVLASDFASAESNLSFDISKGFNWLYNKSVENDWDFSTDTLAFTILALRNEGIYDISEGIDKLKEQERNNHWEGISGSALATLALYKVKEDVDEEIKWLLGEQFTALGDGRWLIQFLVTDGSGECKVNYKESSFDFEINDTRVTSNDCFISDPTWVDFEECIKNDQADLNETLEISCFLGRVKPSILFRTFNNEYYIVDESRPFIIENGCFGSGSDCSCTDTAFASWSLSSMSERAFTGPYLRSQCRESAVELSFLYLVTGEGTSELVNLQKTDGSFEGDEFQTAIAYLALKKGNGAAASKALEWLKFKQRSDGSWNGDTLTTAVVLYSAFSQDLPPTRDGGIPTGNETCESSDECGVGEICKSGRCIPPSQVDCTITDECILDSDCIELGIEYSCNSDCICVKGELPPGKCNSDINCESNEYCDLTNNICKPSSQDEPECRSDEECGSDEECNLASGLCETKEKSSSWIVWLIIGIIVIIAIIGGYIGYNQFFKGRFGKKQKPFTPSTSPSYPTTRQRVPARAQMQQQPRTERSRTEMEFEKQLDESLKKAKELLNKK